MCGVQDSAVAAERRVSTVVYARHGKAARLAENLYHLHRLWYRRQSRQRHLHSLSRWGDDDL